MLRPEIPTIPPPSYLLEDLEQSRAADGQPDTEQSDAA
jgi:hypothetical protein